MYFGFGWYDMFVYMFEKFFWGYIIFGFVVIMSGNSIILVELDCKVVIIKYGNVYIEIVVV